MSHREMTLQEVVDHRCHPNHRARRELEEKEQRIVDLEDQKDAAYEERNRLVAALTKCFPAYLARHPEYDESWEDDWRWIVFVDLPTGQVSWHIHDSERHRFAHLRVDANRWDGHTTEEKYQRLEALPVRTATR